MEFVDYVPPFACVFRQILVCLRDMCTISQLYLKSKSNTNVIIANRIANNNAIHDTLNIA